MIDRIVPIVEGKGEVEAVPILLRRLIAEIDPNRHCDIWRPIRRNRSSLVKQGEFEREVQAAARFAGSSGAVLVLIDADDDRVCELGPALTRRARQARPDRPLMVSLANIEFEHWFLAAAESLRGCRHLPRELSRPPNFESTRDAKKLLSKQYSPTADQAAFTQKMNLDEARENSHSFQRFCTRFRELLA